MPDPRIENRAAHQAPKPRPVWVLFLVWSVTIGSIPSTLTAATPDTKDPAASRSPSVTGDGQEAFAWHPDAGDESDYWKRNLLQRWGGDQKYLLTRWWNQEFNRFGFTLPLAAGIALAASSGDEKPGLDERLARSLSGGSGGRESGLAKGFSRLGDTETAVVLLGGTYLISRWSGNERLSRSSSLAGEALLNAGLWNIALKQVARRTRPTSDGGGNFFVSRPVEEQSPKSFPSGHAMGAFAVATVFANEYPDKRWVPWITYATAGLIGASRISLGRHFPSDVLVGALLGHSIGRMVTARQRDAHKERGHGLEPLFGPEGEGYGLKYVHSW